MFKLSLNITDRNNQPLIVDLPNINLKDGEVLRIIFDPAKIDDDSCGVSFSRQRSSNQHRAQDDDRNNSNNNRNSRGNRSRSRNGRNRSQSRGRNDRGRSQSRGRSRSNSIASNASQQSVSRKGRTDMVACGNKLNNGMLCLKRNPSFYTDCRMCHGDTRVYVPEDQLDSAHEEKRRMQEAAKSNRKPNPNAPEKLQPIIRARLPKAEPVEVKRNDSPISTSSYVQVAHPSATPTPVSVGRRDDLPVQPQVTTTTNTSSNNITSPQSERGFSLSSFKPRLVPINSDEFVIEVSQGNYYSGSDSSNLIMHTKDRSRALLMSQDQALTNLQVLNNRN